MTERIFTSQLEKDQAQGFKERNDKLFDADRNDPLRKSIPFGLVEEIGNWVNEIVVFEV